MQLGISIGIPSTLGKVAAFSPLDLSPVLWLDASDTSTITESGGAVSQWDDLSGNGNDAAQATAANQPTSGTRTLNALNVLDFDGTADYLQVLGDTISQPFTVYAVAKCDVATGAYIFDGATSGNRAGLRLTSGTSLRGELGPGEMTVTSNTDPGIARGVWNGASSTLRWVTSNDERDATWTTTSVDLQLITLGTYQAALGAFFDGAIAELLVIDGTLTADEIAATESYLANKWGITI